jgi:hypothetical protein
MAKKPKWENNSPAKGVTLATELWNKVETAVIKNADLEFRTHLGASVIGDECGRKVYYAFHWANKETPPGRIVRLWDRGHHEEVQFEKILRDAGMEIYTSDVTTGKQFRMSDLDGHYGGSIDGVGKGLPEMPDEWVLLEFKTHNENSFAKLTKEGVRKSKPQHAAQMDTYMKYKGLSFALYCAVNKDTDELYLEIISVNIASADRFRMRADVIINTKTPPQKLTTHKDFMYCKYFCEFTEICHDKVAPLVNCRTCAFSSPATEGTWHCSKLKKTLSKQDQLDACPKYKRNLNFNK